MEMDNETLEMEMEMEMGNRHQSSTKWKWSWRMKWCRRASGQAITANSQAKPKLGDLTAFLFSSFPLSLILAILQ